jgi:hypothetical protein
MSDDRFGKWWPCLRKHYKRVHLWLPQAKGLHRGLRGKRPFRYFTLCARPMIDVYMLVKERVLLFDKDTKRIEGVSFCECDREIFPEMIELIGVEEAGFSAQLEDLVLFQDVPETQTLDSEDSVTRFIEDAGEKLDPAVREKAEGKRTHFVFRDFFPFDFLNLDFCDRYYGNPPDVMRIHATVDKLLDWQRQPNRSASGRSFSVNRFVTAITCRVDRSTPADAILRLKRMVSKNSADHDTYRRALSERSIVDLDGWASESPLDFFMSAWPKEIARLAEQKSWNIAVRNHVHYQRQNERGEDYHMVCLVVEFSQTSICNTYLSTVTNCLDLGSRLEIPHFDPATRDGIALLSNLRQIVKLRNTQATHFSRDPLPDPLSEISRLRAEGVPI